MKIPLLFISISVAFLLSGCDAPKIKSRRAVKVKEAVSEVNQEVAATSSKSPDKRAAFKLGVLDFNRVWLEAKAPVQIRKDIQEKRKKYQLEIIRMEEKLRREENDLQDQHEKLSADEYNEKRKKFEAEVLRVQRQVKLHKGQLEKVYNDAMQRVSKKLTKIVQQVAQEKGFLLILSRTQVAFSENKLDITEEVLAELDKTVPQVAMTE